MRKKLNRKNSSSARTEEELKKIQRNSFVKLSAMCIILAAILLFYSVAWFTMNREVSGEELQMAANDMPFEIATKGDKIRYSEIISQADSEYESGDSTVIDDNTYYKNGSNEKLLLRYDTGESEIGPGDSGELSLYVIPKQDGNLNVRVTLDIKAYAMLDKKNESGETVYKKDENGEDVLDSLGNKIPEQVLTMITADMANDVNQLTLDEVTEYTDAANYLKGHIMFFGGEGDTTNDDESKRYYYTTPYTTREFTTTLENAIKGTAYQIPIYWMWSNTFGQIALPDNTSGQRSGYPVLADSDESGKDLVADYLKSNKSNIFINHEEIKDEMLNTPSESTNFKLLSDGYNKADFAIGTKVSYFMIEVLIEGVE